MPDEPQTSTEKGEKGFFKELSGSAAKRLLEPLAATAATAGTAYLMRKTNQIWNESVLPKVRDKGGAKPFAKDTLEQAANKLPGGRGSGLLHGLAQRLEDESPRETTARAAEQPAPASSGSAQSAATDPKRERQRQERQRRREQRQRELQKTRST
jgi:hypothetical protein